MTASLRATATTARRRPLVRARCMPQSLRSDERIERVVIELAAVKSADRTSASPARDMRPGLSLSPDWYDLADSQRTLEGPLQGPRFSTRPMSGCDLFC
jgi:hypothetical protein